MESSTTRNQKNENSENRRARNEGYFHWLKTGDGIFVVRYSNYSRPTGGYLQNPKSLRSLRNLPVFEAEGFEAFEICRFSEGRPKNTFSMSAKSARTRRGRKMYQKNTPLNVRGYSKNPPPRNSTFKIRLPSFLWIREKNYTDCTVSYKFLNKLSTLHAKFCYIQKMH